MPTNEYHPELMGSAVLEREADLIAGGHAEFVVRFTVGKFGIDDNGSLKIAYRTTNDAGGMQLDDEKASGYTTFETDGNASLVGRFEKWRNMRPWSWSLYIQVVRGFLRPGDTITVRIGDRRGGSPGFRLQTFCETSSPIRLFVDPFATYDYIELPDRLSFEVGPGPVVRWRLIAPTLRGAGEPFDVVIVAEDRWGNPCHPGTGPVRLESAADVRNLPDAVRFADGRRSLRVSGLVAGVGTHAIIATDSKGRRLAESCPIIVVDGTDRHFWGDLHVQTNETVGNGTIREMLEFARDVAALDVVSHQGNDFQITPAFWEDLNRATVEYEEPGRFIAIPGFEWSGNTGVGGDHNVWYRHEGEPIFRSSHALVREQGDTDRDCHTSQELFDALSGYDVVVAAHCGGRYADITYAHDGRVEHSVEIHSSWGTFEWILYDAFDKNYRVGVVANSDDHKCRPGACYPGASNFGAMGGLTCFLAKDLSRDALFESMRRRHHYATTGERLYLDVAAVFDGDATIYRRDPDVESCEGEATDSAVMGDIVEVRSGKVRLDINISSASSIDRVEIRNGRETIETVRPYDAEELGQRIRVLWRGASYRGRARQARWDGEARLVNNEFTHMSAINFWNPDRQPELDTSTRLQWVSTTTGGFSGFDARLKDRDSGSLHVATPLANIDVPIAEIGYHDHVVHAGGLDRRLQVFRLPDVNRHTRFSISRELELNDGRDDRIYICVTLENGHQAWSSPIYFIERT